MAQTLERLSLALEEKDASLGKLAKHLLGAPTETQRNVLRQERPPTPKEPEAKPKNKGHGRNGAAAYTGGARVTLEHPHLKSEDQCPGCEQGKLYELAQPAIFVQVIGTRRSRPRSMNGPVCAVTSAERFLPRNCRRRWASRSIPIRPRPCWPCRDGCGLPLHRIERLQGHLGQPLPSSTQWDLVYAASLILALGYEALVDQAAQGELIHNDDTTMKILSYLQDPERETQGHFYHRPGQPLAGPSDCPVPDRGPPCRGKPE